MISDNLIPALEKRAQYNPSYLKYLLQDVTFTSYLNVFLNLPIFPRRISYVPSKKSFSIEPILMRKYLHVHHSKLCCWLAEKRLPMFIRSHLYFHYLLCKTLCKDNSILKSFLALEAQCPDLPPIRDISGFYNFHHFMITCGQGHQVVTCWLDIERLHSLQGEEKAAFLEKFFDSYLFLDSPRIIQQQYREIAYEQISTICCGLRFVKGYLKGDAVFLQQFKDKLLREKRLFRNLQEKITQDMRSYWLPRYFAHLSRRVCPKDSMVPLQSASSLNSCTLSVMTPSSGFETELLSETDSLPRTIRNKLCSSDGLRRTSQIIYSHDIGMDIAMEDIENTNDTESRIEKNLKNFVGRIQSERIESRKRASSMAVSTSSNKTPFEEDITAKRSFLKCPKTAPSDVLDSFTVDNAPAIRRFSSISQLKRGRSTPPPDIWINPFDSSKYRLVERLQSARKASGLTRQPPCKSVEWSRHKGSRPQARTFECHLEKELDLFRCCPCPLRDEIYKENYCDALKQVYNEASLKEVDINNFLEACIASDSIGGGDFKEYLSEKTDKRALYSYEFWAAVENFSSNYGSDPSMTFCARGYAMNVVGFFSENEKVSFDWNFEKNQMVPVQSNLDNLEKDLHSLLFTYTHPDGEKFTDWDDPFTDSLWFAIVNDHSILEWLLLAQKFASKKLTSEWLEYIEHRENEFLQNCTVLKEGIAPPPFLQHTSEDLLFETISSPNTHVMWTAMQLAEAIKYPGQNKPVLCNVEGYNSPDSRSGASTRSSYTSPTKGMLGGPPNRRMLAGVTTPEDVPVVTINEGALPEEPAATDSSSASARRGDAISSMSMTDPTLAQLEYNLYNVTGLDLSTDRLVCIPKNFLDVLRTRELLAKFRQFLVYNEDNQDTSILFYQIVESLKSCRNIKQRQERMHFIQQKFFGPVSSLKTKMMIDKNCSVYRELCSSKKVTNTILISVQTLVAKEMESVYWLQFVEAFPSHIREKIISMTTRGTLERKEFGKEKNRRLWINFTINVINFKNGIMDPGICYHFREFLAGYVREIVDKCTNSKNTQKRQVVNNKLIDIEKIQADLNFFIEVEKYKEICESVQASARLGNFSPAEEEMLAKKGRVLYQCYIDSLILPKVQINITHDKVAEIRKLHDAGLFERGMFHDAALSLFPSLTYFWKKFCLQRHVPSDVPIVESEKLILKERITKGGGGGGEGYKKGNKTASPKLNHLNVIHVGHVAQGVIHLLNRYTESVGLIQQLCQNNPNTQTERSSKMTRMSSMSAASSKKHEGLGSAGGDGNRLGTVSNTSRRSSATPTAIGEIKTPSSLGVKAPVDRRLSVLTNHGERRASIMSSGRLQMMRDS